MKTLKIIFFAFFLSLSFTSFSQELKPLKTWKETVDTSKRENKKIMLVITASEWCKPCIKMKKKVFSDVNFINKVNEEYVLYILNYPNPIIIDSPVFIESERFVEKYKSNALPSIFIVDSDENLIKTIKKVTSLKKVMQQLEVL
ncbi:thioredoxin family protein [Aureivirga sp. CE67]|uniref:thioredoxin family protein n=1 Tax=Aureivirga sp. CE67 TaxID=1788983 RepID=UPI0018C8F8DC|nr:thioredoxin family protein [Aureivirga sp. CE67]